MRSGARGGGRLCLVVASRLAHCAELFLQPCLAGAAQLILVLKKAKANGAHVCLGVAAKVQFVGSTWTVASKSRRRNQESEGGKGEDPFHGGPPILGTLENKRSGVPNSFPSSG